MRRQVSRSEGGYTLIMVALCLFLLMAAAAFAVDLSAIRHDRAADQKITDSAAAAGALANAKSGAEEGCKAALAYLAVNTPGISESDLNLAACNMFNGTCQPSTARTYSQTVGQFDITYVHPVPDADPLMNTGLMGGGSQAVVAQDGQACERVAVELTSTYNATFARVLGMASGPTTVHTVASASNSTTGGTPLNLLVLDRFGCNALRAEGNGGIIVDAVIDPNAGGPGNPGLVQGVIAADSDGSAGCPTEGVIHLQGSGSMVRADGPEGCANQLFPPPYGGTEVVPPTSFIKGFGCGLVQTVAPGTPGCNLPACSATGSNTAYRPNPFPTSMPKRLTRAPVDHRYNCKADYTTIPSTISWSTWALTTTNEQNIPGCTDTAAPHIDNLITFVGQNPNTPTGFTRWQAAGHSCSLSGGSTVVEVSGDWFVDCPTLTINGATVRIRGNAVFQGNITLGSTGRLEVINTVASPGFAFMRNGVLSKAGQSHVGFYYTMVYASKTFRISLSGGAGSLTWIAPNSGNFDDLALWSDFPTPNNTICSFTPTQCYNWAGQANLRMEGVFFMPFATADYSGGSSQNQTAAQWIADKLTARGSGVLVVAPEEGRAIKFPSTPGTTLIR